MKRITIRLSDEDEVLFDSVKRRINNESDTAAIKYILGNFPYSHPTPTVSPASKPPKIFSEQSGQPEESGIKGYTGKHKPFDMCPKHNGFYSSCKCA